MERKKLNIGLFGFGCVGYGLYEVIQKTPGLKANIKSICVKNHEKERPIAKENFTFDKNDILQDPEINIVVELIDDADAAFEIVQKALQNGKAVVTANKKMVAEHFETLLELQEQYQLPILYEASVCASIPIIRNLEEYYDNDLLSKLEGIVNGSTNYILTKTSLENLSYPEALSEAQKLGYAESNPLLDTGGFDAKYKLLILLAHAFGVISKPDDIFNIGIQNLSEIELQYAREKGYKIKLLAHAFKNGDNEVSAFVAPCFVRPGEKLYEVDNVFNGVILQTAFAENQFFSGRGAGAYPTASAVLSDISALSYNYRYEYKKIAFKQNLKLSNKVKVLAMLKQSSDKLSTYRDCFSQINEFYQNSEEGYILGIMDFSTLRKLSEQEEISIIIDQIIYN